MTSFVENESQLTFDFDIKNLIDCIIEETLNEENCPYEVQVNVLITDNQGIQEINEQFRGLNQPTDVLSFPTIPFEKESDFSIVDGSEMDYFEPETGELMLGDIMLSAEKVKEQAAKYNHSEKREFGFLIAHSMLHLCGYDHMKPEEAEQMEKKQRAILEKLSITR